MRKFLFYVMVRLSVERVNLSLCVVLVVGHVMSKPMRSVF